MARANRLCKNDCRGSVTDGIIEIENKEVKLENPNRASEYGIGCLHQGLGLIDTLNVPENVF